MVAKPGNYCHTPLAFSVSYVSSPFLLEIYHSLSRLRRMHRHRQVTNTERPGFPSDFAFYTTQ